MGIQINGNTDTISASDGSLVVTGAELPTVSNLNVSGVSTTGQLLIGSGTLRTNLGTNNERTIVQIEGVGFTSSITRGRLSIINNAAGAGTAAQIFLCKSYANSIGSNSIVLENDGIGNLSYLGNDGVNFIQSAAVIAQIDGNPGINSMPGRLFFATTPHGSSGATTRMTINSHGNVLIGSGTSTGTVSQNLQVTGGAYVSGNLGVGVTTPGSLLTVGSAADNQVFLGKSDKTHQIIGQGASGIPALEVYSQHGSDQNKIAFAVADNRDGGSKSYAFVVNGIGGVGIGITPQDASLDIKPLSNIPQIKLTQSNVPAGGDGWKLHADGPNGGHMYVLREVSNVDNRVLTFFSTGNIGIGTAAVMGGTPADSSINMYSRTAFGPQIRMRGTSNDQYPIYIVTQRDRNNAACQNADTIFEHQMQGYDGSSYLLGASITGVIEGTVGINTLPTRLVFSTNPGSGGINYAAERARFTSTGYFKASDTGLYHDSSLGGTFHEFRTSILSSALVATASNLSYSGNMYHGSTTRTNNSGFNLLVLETNTFNDREFTLRGDGNAFADGTWTGGGADYAEYFEWVDFNPDEEDRRGISVVLDGDKIREAQDGEDPIGVISGNPSVVGDGAWNKWSGKYLRDDFGGYIRESHQIVEWEEEVLEEEEVLPVYDENDEIITPGRPAKYKTVKHSYEDFNIPSDVVVPSDAVYKSVDENGDPFTHRKLNPDYDPNMEYVPREERPEWDCVGLMGKLRVRKGQIIGSRWIKMRDISDFVEEWLVR